ncbi:hypothetical protein P171DRAFT_477170 [Karstenula rhodostoma CBS 690.94]|uniref:Piwi domain-containing protein n=1 Tax=Karstenula rhodostoma CBS 690.94 TaxID=1392251 RepID=A0A9P4P7D8_9PLEO|nr:hypothetical protein P171DRAFT_477170 [Karstenula rhodostoma CBS 690.94]
MGYPPKNKKIDRNDQFPTWPVTHSKKGPFTARSSTTFDRVDSLFSTTSASTTSIVPTGSTTRFTFEDGTPSSKTSLGKVHYELKRLPALLLIDVDVTIAEPVTAGKGLLPLREDSMGVGGRLMVQSGNLRKQALKEYIEVDLGGLAERKDIALDLEARSNQLDKATSATNNIGTCAFSGQRFGRTNRLIIPVSDAKVAGQLFTKFDQTRDLSGVKKEIRRAEKRANPSKLDHTITCTIVRKSVFLDPKVENFKNDVNLKEAVALYRRSAQLLFEHYCSSAIPALFSGTPSELLHPHEDWVGRSHIHTAAPWKYTVRLRPHFGEDLRLFFDYDLVPVVKDGEDVAKFAAYLFPANHPTAPTSMSQTLKRHLSGLRVTYPFAKAIRKHHKLIAKENHWEVVERTDDKDDSRVMLERAYTIRDVKANSDVGLVVPVTEISEDASKKKFLNVKDYTRKCQAPLTQHLSEDEILKNEFNHLPLADIGKNRPFWVPLDLLKFSSDQVPPHMAHLTEEMQRLREPLDPLQFVQIGVDFLDDLSQNRTGGLFEYDNNKAPQVTLPFAANLTNVFQPYQPLEYIPLEPIPKDRTIWGKIPKPTVAVVYITPDVHSRATNLFLAEVKDALAREAGKGSDHRILDIGMDPDQISAGAVASGPELLRLQDQHKLENLKKLIYHEPDVLIGIIDGHGMSQSKYKEAAAEVRRLGDRKLGAVTVCLRKQDLEERFRLSPNPDEPLFPLNVLLKIRFMLGSMNYETEELDTHIAQAHKEGVIVIGAHISQPAADSTEYCPAVAALVVSRPDNMSFYRAAARLQRPTQQYEQAYDIPEELPQDAWKLSKLKKIYQPEIVNLKDTLEKIFRAWKTDRHKFEGTDLRTKLIPRVVFYRDSYHEIDPEAHKRETGAIIEAYRNEFIKINDVPLSYVTVMKNSRIHSAIPTGEQNKDRVYKPLFTFTTSEYSAPDAPEREEDGAKYQYLVHTNGDGRNMTLEDLCNITRLLNVNSQLCDYTSLALPVHYARKLARRVLSYYDWMAHKDISNYPDLAKKTPYDKVTGEEQLEGLSHRLKNVVSRDGTWDEVREKAFEYTIRPWHKKLDEKMFFL